MYQNKAQFSKKLLSKSDGKNQKAPVKWAEKCKKVISRSKPCTAYSSAVLREEKEKRRTRRRIKSKTAGMHDMHMRVIEVRLRKREYSYFI